MAMTEQQIQGEAWDNVVHSEGTRTIFEDRGRVLKARVKIRDFLSVFVPIVVAFIYSTDWIAKYPDYKNLALVLLSIVGVFQVLMSAWSLVSKWDEDLAYSSRAVRDNYEQREGWKELAKGQAPDFAHTFTLMKDRQKLIDSHDSERDISASDRQSGMRAGLILCQRPCVCGIVPQSAKKPLWVRKPCTVCGGN